MERLHARLLKLEAILAGTLLLSMVGLIFLGGVARLMRHPLNWTIDLATCSFAWACFLAADIAWRNDALMSIDFVAARGGAAVRRLLAYANLAIVSLFLLYVIYAGLWLSWVSRARAFQGIPAVSYSWVTMSMPVGAALLLLTTVLKLRARLRQDGLLGPAAPP
jgi:TRAP-type C4-dicarboxylate transport system permease small subunit